MTTKQALPVGAVALAAIIAGVVVLFGAGWGLLVGGVLVLVATWLLWDPARDQAAGRSIAAQRKLPREAR